MDIAESVAKRVLDAIIPGANLEYQSVQSNGEYDFNLRYADGTVAAVEVTAAINEPYMRTLARIHNERNGGRFIQPKYCRNSWLIIPATDEIMEIRQSADRYLANLEQEGIDSFFCVSSRTQSTRQIYRDLRIAFGSVFPSYGQQTILIGDPIGAGAVGPRVAIKTGETKAWKEDNREKLGAAKTGERHMVVYIPAGSLPWSALTSFEPPEIMPRIPEEITNLWLIGQGKNLNEFVVWYASTSETWRSTKVVCPPETPSIQSFHKMH
jgi:hypothetical protein